MSLLKSNHGAARLMLDSHGERSGRSVLVQEATAARTAYVPDIDLMTGADPFGGPSSLKASF
jgi:hypothetical protein